MLMIDSAKYEWRLWYLWIWIFCSIRVQLCICTLLIDKDKPYVRVLTFWLNHVYILFAVLFVFYACYIMTIGRFLSYFSLFYSFYHYNGVIVSAMSSQITRLSRRRSKKTSKLRVTGLCAENSPVTGEFPTQRASNAENVSIWWRHHDTITKLFVSASLFLLLFILTITLEMPCDLVGHLNDVI